MILNTGFFWILLAGLIYGAIHSAFASRPIKGWVASQFEIGNPKAYRLIYVLQSVFFTIIYLSIVFLLPDALIYLIPFPWIFLSLLIEAAALVCGAISLIQTGFWEFVGLDVFLPPSMVKSVEKLHTTGFYRFVRHPLYLFSLIFIWLLPVMTWNLLAFNIGVTVYIIIGTIYEERKLIQDFGQEYVDYKKRVPAFWPRLIRKP